MCNLLTVNHAAVAHEQWVEAVIDSARFPGTDAILYRIGDLTDEDAAFASLDDLMERGIDVNQLARCIQAGLIDGATIASELLSSEVEDFNAYLDRQLMNASAEQVHPGDEREQFMHGRELCDCFVDWV